MDAEQTKKFYESLDTVFYGQEEGSLTKQEFREIMCTINRHRNNPNMWSTLLRWLRKTKSYD